MLPLASRILATPLSLRQLPRPYVRCSRGNSRIPGPLAIVSTSVIGPRTSKSIAPHFEHARLLTQAFAERKAEAQPPDSDVAEAHNERLPVAPIRSSSAAVASSVWLCLV